MNRLIPLVGGDPSFVRGFTSEVSPGHTWQDSGGAWSAADQVVRLNPAYRAAISDYVRTGVVTPEAYSAVHVVVHELQHAQSKPINSRTISLYEPNVEEGLVEYRARRLTEMALFGPLGAPPTHANRLRAYPRQHAAVKRVRDVVGDAQIQRIFDAPDAKARRKLLNQAIAQLPANERAAVRADLA
jgi:hypothetical protein